MSEISISPFLAVVGTTASGKSSVAMELAKRVERLEIISVDSMQIYRGMDVGTVAEIGRASCRERV